MAKKGYVLVVEHDPLEREQIVKVLESYGYEVTSTEDGFVAFGYASFARFDLILVDMELPTSPGWGGERTLHALKDATMHWKPWFVALTARAPKGDEDWLNKCSAYISKPVDSDELIVVTIKALLAEL